MNKTHKTGGYRQLASFQTATLIYDATYWFCEKFLDQRSRTVDQMIQAARSGRQNIAEGSRAAATSSQTELRLMNVARASLEELLLDFEDYLRHRRLPLWAAGSPEASAVRNVQRQFRKDRSDRSDQSDRTDRSDRTDLANRTDQQRWLLYSGWLDNPDAAVRANAIICLIHQANYLLDQQIATLEDRFIAEGGYRERLAAARLAQRVRSRQKPDPSDPTDRSDPTDLPDPSDRSDPTDPTNLIPNCPRCRKPMVLRTAKQGECAGQNFWGCSGYPDCRQTVPL